MENDTTQGSGTSSTEVFDVRRVRRLVELMNDHDLSEIDLRQGEQRIRLRRGADTPVISAVPAPIAPPPVAAPAPAPAAAPPAAAETPSPAADVGGKTINSPMVGTFYDASSPESAAFVSVGDQVGPDTTVCIVEAMKVFNEIPAECSGKIAAVLVSNGDAVEFGQPLFRVE